jgi:hypothetical protein
LRNSVLAIAAITIVTALVGCSPKSGSSTPAQPASSPAPTLSAAPAPTAWPTYTNADFGISIDTPQAPAIQSGTVQSDIGPTPQLIGTMKLPGDAVMNFGVQDYGQRDLNDDVNLVLDHAVAAGVAKTHLVVDKLDKIEVDGVPGREITGHLGDYVLKSRVLLAHKRILTLTAIAHAKDGVPADYARMEASLKVTK